MVITFPYDRILREARLQQIDAEVAAEIARYVISFHVTFSQAY
jgi:hypothetical protein